MVCRIKQYHVLFPLEFVTWFRRLDAIQQGEFSGVILLLIFSSVTR